MEYVHFDYQKTAEELAGLIAEPLRLSAYLSGHLDGISDKLESPSSIFGPNAMSDAVLANGLFDLLEELRRLWDSRDSWKDISDLFEIGEKMMEMMSNFGVTITPMLDGGADIRIST